MRAHRRASRGHAESLRNMRESNVLSRCYGDRYFPRRAPRAPRRSRTRGERCRVRAAVTATSTPDFVRRKCRRGARVHPAAHLLARASGLAAGGRTGDQHQSRRFVGSFVLTTPRPRGSGVAVPARGCLTGRHDKRRGGQPDERDKDQEHVANLCAVL